MGQWVRTDVDFETPAAWLFLTERTVRYLRRTNHVPDLMILLRSEDPEGVERVVLDMIEEYRPDLAGGLLYSIRYDFAPARWRFLYCHRSLPRIAQGEVPPDLPLIEDSQIPVTWFVPDAPTGEEDG